MTRKCIDTHMVDILQERGLRAVWYGSIEEIDDCARRAQMSPCHPLEMRRRVLNSLARSSLFEKTYLYEDVNGRRKKFRCFRLKNI